MTRVTKWTYTDYPVRIGVQIQPQQCTYSQIRRAAARMEELGVDVLLNWDHFFPQYKPSDDRHYECWTMLGAWAEATSEIEIGPLVSCMAYRNPDLLADMARTVDHIAGGRLVLGVGAGWNERDFQEYGYEFGTPGSRLDRLSDGLARVKRRLGLLNPAPVRQVPLLIGGNGPQRTMPLAARYADIWHGFGDPAALAERNRHLDAMCVALGRDPGAIERSTRVFRRSAEDIGQALVNSGIRFITLVTQGPDFDDTHVQDWLDFRDETNKSYGS